MNTFIRLSSVTAALLLAANLTGCESFGKCEPQNCANDAKTKQEVNQLFYTHTEYGPPGTIRVQVINGIVYLTGTVQTDLQRREAAKLAMRAENVQDVVNSINVDNASR